MKKIVFFLLLAVMGLALAACSGSATLETPQAFTVEASNLKFSPATIEVTAGQPVKLTLRNRDTVEHDLSAMEIPITGMDTADEPVAGHDMSHMADTPDLHVVAAAGGTGSIEFTPTEPGTYQLSCTVPGHAAAGMVGSLVVKAP